MSVAKLFTHGGSQAARAARGRTAQGHCSQALIEAAGDAPRSTPTSVVINERPPAVLQAFREHEAEGLGVSSVTAAELFHGVARTGSQRNLQALRRFLAPLEIAAFDVVAAVVCGALRAWLAAQGTPSGPMTRKSPRLPMRSASRWSVTTRASSRAWVCLCRTGRRRTDRQAAGRRGRLSASRRAQGPRHCAQ